MPRSIAPLTPNGEFGTPLLDQGLVRAPGSATLQNGRLVWTEQQGVLFRPGQALLKDFLLLTEASDSKVLEFVARWGGLKLCYEGRPGTHLDEAGERTCEPTVLAGEDGAPLFSEAPGDYRKLAQKARALLKIADALHNERHAETKDRAILGLRSTTHDARAWHRYWQKFGHGPFKKKPSRRRSIPARRLEHERMWLAAVLTQWLSDGVVELRIDWHSARQPTIVLGSRTLFGNLAVQLAWAAAGSEGWALCSACGRLYKPTRRPREGQRRFCQRCRNAGRSVEAAKRDHRRKKRVEAMKRDGLSLPRIAVELGTDVEAVSRSLRQDGRRSR